jgi:endonuclease YncB( thermonuclease family)
LFRFRSQGRLRVMWWCTSVLVALAVALSVAAEPAARARVVDGDSLVVAGERVRLHAIDAPELREPLGGRAKMEMERIIGGKEVSCAPRGADRYGNTVATCHVGRTDVGREIVRRGWARAWPKYGLDYVAAESEARAAGRGMWAPRLQGARRSPRHPE